RNNKPSTVGMRGHFIAASVAARAGPLHPPGSDSRVGQPDCALSSLVLQIGSLFFPEIRVKFLRRGWARIGKATHPALAGTPLDRGDPNPAPTKIPSIKRGGTK